jgi:PAS domain S-box-containing protein
MAKKRARRETTNRNVERGRTTESAPTKPSRSAGSARAEAESLPAIVAIGASAGALTGAVLAVVNIDGTRRFSAHQQQSRAAFQTVFETVRQPLVLLGADLKIHLANQAFYDRFKLNATETEGRHIAEIGDGDWASESVQSMIRGAFAGSPRNDFEIASKAGGRSVRLKLSAQPVVLDGARPAVLVAIQDNGNAGKA